MNILYLGPDSNIVRYLRLINENVMVYEDKLTLAGGFDYIISYRYRHRISKDIIDYMSGRIINLHISYLPFNKGADPNFWSFVDDTPKGVSIHKVSETIDDGDILIQRMLCLDQSLSLRQTYDILSVKMNEMFMQNWQRIKSNLITAKPNVGGNYHKSIDKDKYISEIRDKYLDIPITELLDYIGDLQMSASNRDNMLTNPI